MTLSTDLYILSKVDPRGVFALCQGLLDRPIGEQIWEEREGWSDDGSRMLMNRGGQGMNAWLMVHYRPDAALLSAEDAAKCDEDCDEGCDGTGWSHQSPCWAKVNWDTAYGFNDSQGGCGSLHARFIYEVGTWLDEQGVGWKWRNEFTGDIYDRFDGLDTLIDGGSEAEKWFKEMALPAIALELASATPGRESAPSKEGSGAAG